MPVSAATEGRKPSGEVTAGSARKPPPIAVPARIAAASVVVVCSSCAALQLTTGQGRRRPHEVESRVTRRGAAGDAGRSALAPARSASKRRLHPTARMVRSFEPLRAGELSCSKKLFRRSPASSQRVSPPPPSRCPREIERGSLSQGRASLFRGQACALPPEGGQPVRPAVSARDQPAGPYAQRPPEKDARLQAVYQYTVPWLEG